METTMYTFTANEIVVAGSAVRQASGGDRRMVYLRHSVQENAPASGGKVIDFNAWRAAQEAQACVSSSAQDDHYDSEIECDDFSASEEIFSESIRRPRTHHVRHERRSMYLDWMASAALIAVSVSVCISFLL